MADVTLKQGIEVAIKEAVPGITEILNTTDHAAVSVVAGAFDAHGLKARPRPHFFGLLRPRLL